VAMLLNLAGCVCCTSLGPFRILLLLTRGDPKRFARGLFRELVPIVQAEGTERRLEKAGTTECAIAPGLTREC
jgi:hypothetical protein